MPNFPPVKKEALFPMMETIVDMANVINARPTWEEYALSLAFAARIRSEDPFVQVGACVLRPDNSVAALGYNGVPSGIVIDWSDREERRKYVIHAEKNCLKYCQPGNCQFIAVTLLPCADCILTIASYGIKKVLYRDLYERDQTAFTVADKFGIELKQI